MLHYLTIERQHNQNSSTFVYIGCYDTQAKLQKALTQITSALLLGGNQIISIKPYTRPDNADTWYVTYK